MVWYGMVWYGMVWYGMVWYGMVWYGMVWYGMVCMVWYVWYGIEGKDGRSEDAALPRLCMMHQLDIKLISALT
jgi:hypothetical protein